MVQRALNIFVFVQRRLMNSAFHCLDGWQKRCIEVCSVSRSRIFVRWFMQLWAVRPGKDWDNDSKLAKTVLSQILSKPICTSAFLSVFNTSIRLDFLNTSCCFNTTNLTPLRDILRRLRSFWPQKILPYMWPFLYKYRLFENTRLVLVIFNF